MGREVGPWRAGLTSHLSPARAECAGGRQRVVCALELNRTPDREFLGAPSQNMVLSRRARCPSSQLQKQVSELGGMHVGFLLSRHDSSPSQPPRFWEPSLGSNHLPFSCQRERTPWSFCGTNPSSRTCGR